MARRQQTCTCQFVEQVHSGNKVIPKFRSPSYDVYVKYYRILFFFFGQQPSLFTIQFHKITPIRYTSDRLERQILFALTNEKKRKEKTQSNSQDADRTNHTIAFAYQYSSGFSDTYYRYQECTQHAISLESASDAGKSRKRRENSQHDILVTGWSFIQSARQGGICKRANARNVRHLELQSLSTQSQLLGIRHGIQGSG